MIEYCERQHTEAVAFFDHNERLTVSGVTRGEQRKIYDQRRRDLLKNELTVLFLFMLIIVGEGGE